MAIRLAGMTAIGGAPVSACNLLHGCGFIRIARNRRVAYACPFLGVKLSARHGYGENQLSNMKLSKIAVYVVLFAVVGASAFWAGRVSVLSSNSAGKNAADSAKAKNTGDSITLMSDTGQPASLTDLLNSKGKPSADLLAAWAKNLTPEETAAALKSLQGMPAGLQRNALLTAVVNAWADRDPQGFLAANSSVTVPRLREGGVDTALKTWAAQDPQAALDWLKANPGSAPPSALQQRYASAIAGMASTDPAGAFSTVNALTSNNPADAVLKNNAMLALTNALADSGNFSDAMTMFGQMAPGQMQNTAYNTLVQRWADANPVDASAYIASLTDPTQRAQLGARVAQTWAASDPASAAAWAAQMDQQAGTTPGANGQANNQLLANAISSWASYDLDAPAQFLNQLPAGAGKDNAVAIFAMSAGQQDPASAEQWVGTITDDQLRARAATAVAFEMLAQDPNTFNTFISNTTLIPDQAKQALQSIPPGMVNGIGYALAGGTGGFGGGGFGGGGGGFGGGAPGGGGQVGTGIQGVINSSILNGGGPLGRIMNGGGPGGGGGGNGGGGGGGGGGGRRFGGGGGGFGGGGFGGGGGGGGGG